ALPSRDAMLAEMQQLKDWKRSWMPFSSARGARLLLHMLYYHDELLRDFGANPLRKLGILAPLKELFVPYQPHDYRAIVAGDWAVERREHIRRLESRDSGKTRQPLKSAG